MVYYEQRSFLVPIAVVLKAIKNYNKLLEIWEEADEDIKES
jgi:hypothetical protein